MLTAVTQRCYCESRAKSRALTPHCFQPLFTKPKTQQTARCSGRENPILPKKSLHYNLVSLRMEAGGSRHVVRSMVHGGRSSAPGRQHLRGHVPHSQQGTRPGRVRPLRGDRDFVCLSCVCSKCLLTLARFHYIGAASTSRDVGTANAQP